MPSTLTKDIKELVIFGNKDILTAIKDGYKQSEIAKHLKISPAMVSKVFRGVK